MRTPPLLFVSFFLLVLTLPSAGQVRADGTSDYLYSFGGNTFAWDLPSNPVIPPGNVYPGNAFTIPDLSFTENGLAMVGTLDFYNISSGGGFDLWTGNYLFLCNAFGPQLYTGPESAPHIDQRRVYLRGLWKRVHTD